jgi:hypothetical protein
MSLDHPPHVLAADTVVTQSADAVIWLHAAFCSMGLPMHATRGVWQRNVGAETIRIEPSLSDDVVPSGHILRLSMMHICDAAFRANSQVVELGGDSTFLATTLNVDTETPDLADQWQRLQAARILVSAGGRAEVSVFDARSRRRAGDLGWRSGVRLSTKFLASLVAQAVPLDRRVVRQLSATPAALDAYEWIKMSLQHATADQIVAATWADLLKRFGTASQDLVEFRSAFEAALRFVFEADRSIDLAVDDDGVRVRHADPTDSGTSAADTTESPPSADVVDIDAAKPLERPAVPPSTMPVLATSEVTAPIACNLRNSASQQQVQGQAAVAATAAGDRIKHDSISLPGHLTGLTLMIWLRRGHGEESVVVGVTPGPRFEAERLTVLAVEPMVLQVSGGLNDKDFERVSAWVMSNRDVIDEFWEGQITSFAEINQRVRKAPAQGWR